MQNPDPVKVNLEYEIIRPVQERAYVVPRTEWLRLVERLERAKGASAFYDSAGWALVATAATIFVGSWTVQAGPWRYTTWAFALAALFAGLLALHFARKHSGDRNSLLSSVIDDMRARAGADPEDSAGVRRTYRAVAYLRHYLQEALLNQPPFSSSVATWELTSDVHRIQLSLNDRHGRYISGSIDVAPDWPTGESWAYTIKLGRMLLEQLPNELLQVRPSEWKGERQVEKPSQTA